VGEISSGAYALRGLEPQPGDEVIDIGANVGVFALWATHRGATVTAYEPAPATFAHLVANTYGRSVTPIQSAVVGKPTVAGTVRLYLHERRSTRHTLLGHEIGTGEPLEHHVDVVAVSIGDVLGDGCDLLKIDCEGGEFAIFREMKFDALRNVRRVVLEFHRSAGDPEQLLTRLRDAGFDANFLSGHDEGEAFGVIGAIRQ